MLLHTHSPGYPLRLVLNLTEILVSRADVDDGLSKVLKFRLGLFNVLFLVNISLVRNSLSGRLFCIFHIKCECFHKFPHLKNGQ